MGITSEANKSSIEAPVLFYNLTATANNGEQISFDKYKRKKILLVNVASKCGFTPQYDELEKLQQLQKHSLAILGFPSDDFGGQEPGSDSDIAEFCSINFGVTFQLFHKDFVTGINKQVVYQWLSEASKNGWNNTEPSWNFCKYLVDENGNLQHFFSPAISPLSEEVTKHLIDTKQ